MIMCDKHGWLDSNPDSKGCPGCALESVNPKPVRIDDRLISRRIPTPDPITMRDICVDFVKSNGWKELVTTIPGSPQIKTLYQSPITGNWHSLSFAIGVVFEHHGIPAA